MCYNKSYLTKRLEKYAKRYGDGPEEIKFVQDPLFKLNISPVYHVSGFDHPDVPVIIDNTNTIHLFSWGLIPHWVKSPKEAVEISNRTINARAETMFEKSAFREPARNRRCLILTDGFFEHHHKKNKTFPYHIRLRSDEPMTMAGLWDEWKDEASGMMRRTYAVVTTRANPLMARIHNNPKPEAGPRMPLLLPKELEKEWMKPIHEKADRDLIETLVQPYDEDALETFTVKRLLGKEAIGNKPDVLKPFRYVELEESQGSLF